MNLHQVVSQITPSQVEPEDSMGKSITLVDRDGVRDAITRIEDNAGSSARSIQGKDSLDGDIHGRSVECLEHDLGHLLPVSLGVKGSLSQEDWMLLGGNSQLVVEGVMPDLFHVVPVGDDSVLNGILQGQNSSLGLSLVTYIGVLLSHTHHDSLMSRPSNN